MAPSAREALLRRIADLIEQYAEELAAIQSPDLGATVGTSCSLAQGTIEAFLYYADWPAKMLGQTFPSDGTPLSYSVREPLGLVAANIP